MATWIHLMVYVTFWEALTNQGRIYCRSNNGQTKNCKYSSSEIIQNFQSKTGQDDALGSLTGPPSQNNQNCLSVICGYDNSQIITAFCLLET